MLLGTLLATSTPQQNVVLEFGAEWCQPCQRIKPMIHKLERDGYPIQSVDFDQRRDLADKYGVRSIPCLVLIVDGKMKQKSLYNANEQTRSNQILEQMLTQAQNARIAARQKPKGKPKQLDGNRGGSSNSGTDIKLVIDQNESKFNFPFGMGGKPAATAMVGSTPPAATNQNHQPIIKKSPIVRIKVYDKSGINLGSGTLIESTRDRCTVLSCQHIFRDSDQNSKIEVDVFSGSQAKTLTAKLIKTDADADLSLLELNTHHRFPVAKIATLEQNPKKGDHVFSLGCGGGRDPEKQQTRVTGVNRYKGPDTIDCFGSPEQGRSGGGLFNTKEELVGVCFGDQAGDNRGIYSGLKPIYQLLDGAKLSYLHPATQETSQPVTELAATSTTPPQTQSAIPANPAKTASQLELIKAALEQAGDAEVICIVRPKNSPNNQSKVMIINQASPKLIGYLQNDTQQAPKATIQPAMKHVPNRDMSVQSAVQPVRAPQTNLQPQGFAPISTDVSQPAQPAVLTQTMPEPLTGQKSPPFSAKTPTNPESPWGNSPFK